MSCEVEVTDEFALWFKDTLDDKERESVVAVVGLLEQIGIQLSYPYSSSIASSRHPHMRELRIQHRGRPLRALYAFDPRRTAILLIGGDKTGDDRWYQRFVPLADTLYDQHLQILAEEGYTDA